MRSPITRQGGKYRLLKRLLPLVPDHSVYVEAFAGAAWLLFAKEPARLEVINDADGDLITFYRVVAYHEPEFSHWLRFLPRSKQTFDELKDQPTLTDVQRAVLWYWRNRVSFGGKGDSFGRHRSASTSIRSIPTDFLTVSERLKDVCIEHGDFEWVIRYYDRPGTFFFLDPPYLGTDQKPYHTPPFKGEDADRLRELLTKVEGDVLLTVGGPEAERYVPEGWIVEGSRESYSVGKSRPKADALIARNYEIEPTAPKKRRAARPRPKPSDEYKSPYAVVGGNEGSKCNYPARLDPYGRGCAHGCLYCYARSVLEFRGLWNDEPASADPAKVREKVARELFKAGAPIWGRTPLRIGGLTDAFQPAEKERGVTRAVLELLNEYSCPYLIVTKGDLVAEQEYLDLLDPELCNVQVTVPFLDEELAAKIEPQAPTPTARLEAIRKLGEAGLPTTLRLSPVVWPDWVEAETLAEMLDRGRPGTVLVEFLRVNHFIEERLGEHLDIGPYSVKAHGYRHLPLKRKVELCEEIKGLCDERGAEMTVCEDEDEAYEELKRFWANPADCCNLKGAVRKTEARAS